MIQHMGKCRNEGEASRSKQYCTISCQCKDLRARRSSQRALRTRTACTIARATALHTAFHTRYGGQIWVVAVGRCTGQTAAARNLQDMCRTDAAPQHVLHCGCAAGCDAGILTLRASGWQARAHRGQGGRASGGVVFVCVWLGAGYMCGGDACTWTSQRGSPVLYDVHGGRGAKRYGVNGCRTQLGSARVCMGGGGGHWRRCMKSKETTCSPLHQRKPYSSRHTEWLATKARPRTRTLAATLQPPHLQLHNSSWECAVRRNTILSVRKTSARGVTRLYSSPRHCQRGLATLASS